jgi:rhomboid family GlyGly-CTERM serine protease
LDQLFQLLVLDREAVAGGEVWRLFSCHIAHYSLEHLAFNCIGCAVAYAVTPPQMRRRLPGYFAIGAFIISASLLALEPEMARYAGASGIVCGWLFLAALVNVTVRQSVARIPRWSALLLALIIVGKVSIELLTSSVLLPYGEQNFVSMHLAHATGIAVAIVFHLALSAANPDKPGKALQAEAV